jgi:hypothetical protein
MIDVRPVGIPIVLTSETIGEIESTSVYDSIPIETSSLLLQKDGTFDIGPKRFINIGPYGYTILGKIGSGKSGIILKVEGSLCVKLQLCLTDLEKTNAVKEAIIHYRLGKVAPELHYVNRYILPRGDETFEYIGFLMELAEGSLDTMLEDPTFDYTRIPTIVNKVATLLKQVPQFNHGDLHSGNILFIGGEPRLADFGYSRLIEDGLDISTYNEDGKKQVIRMSPSRDMTRLAKDIQWFVRHTDACITAILPNKVEQTILAQPSVPMRNKTEVWINKQQENPQATPNAVAATPACAASAAGGYRKRRSKKQKKRYRRKTSTKK